jgi:hypothetical protein
MILWCLNTILQEYADLYVSNDSVCSSQHTVPQEQKKKKKKKKKEGNVGEEE